MKKRIITTENLDEDIKIENPEKTIIVTIAKTIAWNFFPSFQKDLVKLKRPPTIAKKTNQNKNPKEINKTKSNK